MQRLGRIALGTILVLAGTSPAFAESKHANGEWAQKEQRLEASITATLQMFVPQVQATESALTAQLSGTGNVVTGSVYGSSSIAAEIATIQAAANQLQTSDVTQLSDQLKVLQQEIEHAREAISKVANKESESASKNRLQKVQQVYATFQSNVSTLQTADSDLKANPTSQTAFDTAKEAWKNVEHNGKKIQEWSKEWSAPKAKG